MTNSIFRRKALERWENEGGRIYGDRTEIIKTGQMNARASKDHAAQNSESPSLNRNKVRKNKGNGI